jgi:hypothetical protein
VPAQLGLPAGCTERMTGRRLWHETASFVYTFIADFPRVAQITGVPLSHEECLDRRCTLGSRVFPLARVNTDIPLTFPRLRGAGPALDSGSA